jgi:hypothetical protein
LTLILNVKVSLLHGTLVSQAAGLAEEGNCLTATLLERDLERTLRGCNLSTDTRLLRHATLDFCKLGVSQTLES